MTFGSSEEVPQFLLDPISVYYWRAKARRSNGKWDTRWAFTSAFESSRVQPRDVAPKMNADGVEPWPVKVGWEPVPGADTYEVQVADDNEFPEGVHVDFATGPSSDGLLRQAERHPVLAGSGEPRRKGCRDSVDALSVEGPAHQGECSRAPWTPGEALQFRPAGAEADALTPGRARPSAPGDWPSSGANVRANRYTSRGRADSARNLEARRAVRRRRWAGRALVKTSTRAPSTGGTFRVTTTVKGAARRSGGPSRPTTQRRPTRNSAAAPPPATFSSDPVPGRPAHSSSVKQPGGMPPIDQWTREDSAPRPRSISPIKSEGTYSFHSSLPGREACRANRRRRRTFTPAACNVPTGSRRPVPRSARGVQLQVEPHDRARRATR